MDAVLKCFKYSVAPRVALYLSARQHQIFFLFFFFFFKRTSETQSSTEMEANLSNSQELQLSGTMSSERLRSEKCRLSDNTILTLPESDKGNVSL